ncbi:hypothetical protein PFISCL1PPCAC_27069, partial [Pristionchus fissidentatus]
EKRTEKSTTTIEKSTEMKTIVLLLSLLALSSSQSCSFQSQRAPYTLNWIVDPNSQNIFFNLTYRNFPMGSFTGVGFGDNMASGLDVILVSLPSGQSTPQVIDASVRGYTMPTRDANSEVQTRASSWIGGTLNAQFIRPLTASNANSKALNGCMMWNFITSPGAAYANGTYAKHSSTPEQQQQCNVAARCTGTIPAQFINTPNNGGWGNQNNQWTNGNQQFNQNQQFYQQQPQVNPQFGPRNPIGNGVGMQSQYYNPYGNQQQQQSQWTQQRQFNQQQPYGRKKRQANTNIYGYNYDSNAGNNGPTIVQNPNYQFIPNYLAEEYGRTYQQISAQYDATNGRNGVNGVQRNPGQNQATQPPVLTNQQQNQQNYQNIQRDTASGAYSTIAPATNIYGYNYDTPSSSGLLSTQLSPSSSSSRQFDSLSPFSVSTRDQSLERFYNPGVTAAGNVYTGSLYNGGGNFVGSPSSSSSFNSNGVFYDSSSSYSGLNNNNGRQFDTNGNVMNNNNHLRIASPNRGPQPGQIVFYDPSTFGRKKRSTDSVRSKRQVFYDPGNNQSAMYYPYRTETDFNLNAGQRGFSQVGGQQYNPPNYNGGNGGNGVNAGANGQLFYDTSRGVYVNTPQFDSRGGNQYLKTAPVNPQSANFIPTLQNNARALNDYVDASCSNADPYWCQSYVQQIMTAQNSFGSYSAGLCNTLVASLQYSDNRCCNAVRAAGCQSDRRDQSSPTTTHAFHVCISCQSR